ncbi:hypothetical protein COLO4_08887 [Corchorus olitorius]|uniref:Uncharacterized protein n=1 Tax=Corchorus olitorius TaxID=93759 RepID=A0A1R3KE83_9ROSI|nr:hypothetical protein COLO4_08887 [Corchorus olitorius]
MGGNVSHGPLIPDLATVLQDLASISIDLTLTESRSQLLISKSSRPSKLIFGGSGLGSIFSWIRVGASHVGECQLGDNRESVMQRENGGSRFRCEVQCEDCCAHVWNELAIVKFTWSQCELPRW